MKSLSEVVWNKRKEMGQVHRGVYDETCREWVTVGMREGATQLKYLEPSGLEPTHVRWMLCEMCETREKCASVSRSVRSTWCSVFNVGCTIPLGVVHAILLTPTTVLNMRMMPATSEISSCGGATQGLRMVSGALFLPLVCRHSLVLVHVEELQVCEWFSESRPFLS